MAERSPEDCGRRIKNGAAPSRHRQGGAAPATNQIITASYRLLNVAGNAKLIVVFKLHVLVFANATGEPGVFTGEIPADVGEAYAVLHEAQQAATAAAVVGAACQDVDRAARSVIADAGYGEYFIHRTGHGIGLEAHEDPYIVEGNTTPLVAGNAFSVEPGIYIPGKWGARLEDIVVAAQGGPDALNKVDHHLAAIDV